MLVVRVLVAGPRAARLRGAPQRLFTRRFSPLAWYNKHLEKTPMLTKTITSGSKILIWTWLVVLQGLGIMSAHAHAHSNTSLYNMYRIDYTKEWVMRLCNPRVYGYPEAKPMDKCKQVGYSV